MPPITASQQTGRAIGRGDVTSGAATVQLPSIEFRVRLLVEAVLLGANQPLHADRRGVGGGA